MTSDTDPFNFFFALSQLKQVQFKKKLGIFITLIRADVKMKKALSRYAASLVTSRREYIKN